MIDFLFKAGASLIETLGKIIAAKALGKAAEAEAVAKEYIEAHSEWGVAYAAHTKAADDAEAAARAALHGETA